jgi:pentatricopeptide repeat protein
MDRNFNVFPSSFAMANKLLIESRNITSLRYFLGGTLHRTDIDAVRLIDYAVRSVIKDNPNDFGVSIVSNLLEDMMKSALHQHAKKVLIDSMSLLLETQPSASRHVSAEANVHATLSADGCALLLFTLLEEGRRHLGKSNVPRRAYTLVAFSCRSARNAGLMLQLFRLAREDATDDKMLRNIIIHTLARSVDHWDTAIDIIEEAIHSKSATPDIYMFNSALIACDTGKDWEYALFLLEKMEEMGHELGTVSFTTVITCCATCGKADEALRMLDVMAERRIHRTVWTFNAAIAACARVGRWKDALSVFEKMRQEGNYVEAAAQAATSRTCGIVHDAVRVSSNSCILDGGVNDEKSLSVGPALGLDEMGFLDETNTEEVGMFHAMSTVANEVTYNTLIEALGEGGQQILVDDIYQEAIKTAIVTPFLEFDNGFVDLHGHSVHMAKASIRLAFEQLLAREPQYCDGGASFESRGKCLTIIVGKGKKLLSEIQQQLSREFHPSLKSYVSQKNSGRLIVPVSEVAAWLQVHKSLRV